MTEDFKALEENFGKVKEIQKVLEPAEAALETSRGRVWRLLGGEPFGAISIFGLRFSRLMLVVGGAFLAGTIFMFATPILGMLAALTAIAVGVVWLKTGS